jgi:hypothetical protein
MHDVVGHTRGGRNDDQSLERSAVACHIMPFPLLTAGDAMKYWHGL